MTTKRADPIEVASGPLQAELIEIKERLGSLETVTSLANRKEVETLSRALLTTQGRRDIMRKCENPRTKEQLRQELGHANIPALDHHLNPLRGGDLIHQRTDVNGILTFEWSRLFRSLPKHTKAAILGESSDGKTIGKKSSKKS